METLWWILIILLFVAGVAGLFLPVLPDAPLLLAGFVLYHFLINPDGLNLSFWIGAVLITLAVMLIDYVAGGIAVKTYGGSKASVWAAVAGALIGLFFGPLGILVGPVLAVILVELLNRKSWREAVKVGWGTVVGFLGGLLVKGVLMTGLLVWFFILVL